MAGLFVFFAVQIFCGWSVLSALRVKKRFSILESFALAYGVGMGFVSLESFLFLLFKLPVNPGLILLPWVILAAINIFRKSLLTPDRKIIFELAALSRFERFLLCAIVFEIIYSFFRAAVMPMDAYDSVAIWGFKAKAIYLEQALPVDLFKNGEYAFMHMDYPLLIPLQEAFFYNLYQGINDAAVKVIFPAYFFGLLIIFASGLYRLFGRRSALIFTFLLASLTQVNNFSQNGYADLVLAFYYSLGALSIYLWFIKEGRDFLFLAAVFSAIGAWVKNEGIALCFLNLLLLSVLTWVKKGSLDKARLKAAGRGMAFYLTMALLFIAPWYWFRHSLGLNGDLFPGKGGVLARLFGGLGRILKIFDYYQIQFFDIKRWNILWVLFLSTFLFRGRFFLPKFLPLSLSFIGTFGLYTAIYVLTPLPLEWHLSSSVSRLFIHIVPLAVFWLALVYDDQCKTVLLQGKTT